MITDQSTEESMRHQEVMALDLSVPSNRSQLLSFFRDDSLRVRHAALSRLDDIIADESVIALLCHGLSSEHTIERNVCYEALTHAGPALDQHLYILLTAPQANLRRYALGLVSSRARHAFRPQIQNLLQDPDENVVCAAIEALANLGHRDDIPILLSKLRSIAPSNALLATYTLAALAKLDAEASATDLSAWLMNRSCASYTFWLCRHDLHALNLFTAALQNGSSEQACAAVIAMVPWLELYHTHIPELRRQFPSFTKTLIPLLTHDDTNIAMAALSIVGALGDASFAPMILQSSTKRESIEQAVAIALSFGSAAETPILEKLFQVDMETRVLMIEILEIIGGPTSITCLLEVVRSQEPRTQEAALRALGALGDARCARDLVELTRQNFFDPSDGIYSIVGETLGRIAARMPEDLRHLLHTALSQAHWHPAWILALGFIGSANDLDYFIEASRHRDATIRIVSMQAASYLPVKLPENIVVFALADEHPDVRRYAAKALEFYVSSVALQALLVAIDDEHPAVAAQALLSLGAKPDPRASSALSTMTTHQSSPRALAALRALFRSNAPNLGDVLSHAVHHLDPEVVSEALDASMRLPSTLALPLVTTALNHKAWVVRRKAAEHISKRSLSVPRTIIRQALITEQDTLVKAALQQVLMAGVHNV